MGVARNPQIALNLAGAALRLLIRLVTCWRVGFEGPPRRRYDALNRIANHATGQSQAIARNNLLEE